MLHNHELPNDQLVNLISDLRKFYENKNAKGFKAPDAVGLQAKYAIFNRCYKGLTPIHVLARAGEVDFVNFLLKSPLSGNQNCATTGYAEGGYFAEANELIEAGVPIYFKLVGLARGGHVELVHEALRSPPKGMTEKYLDAAATGFVWARRDDLVDLLLLRGANVDKVVQAYSAIGNTQKVNELLSRGAMVDCVLLGIAQSGIDISDERIELDSRSYTIEPAQRNLMDKIKRFVEMGGSLAWAIRGFAAGGHQALVNLYIGRHHEGFNFALAGYALHKHVDSRVIDDLKKNKPDSDTLVDNTTAIYIAQAGYADLIKKYRSRRVNPSLIIGFSCANNTIELDNLNASPLARINGYALTNNVYMVDKLLATSDRVLRKDLRNAALTSFARNGFLKQVNRLFATYGECEREAACDIVVKQYLLCNVINYTPQTLFYVLAMTNSDTLRARLIDAVVEKFGAENNDYLIVYMRKQRDLNNIYYEASKVNRIMQRYQLTFEQAKSLRKPGLYGWLMQGHRLNFKSLTGDTAKRCDNSVFIPADIFYSIGTMLSGLSRNDLEKIYEAISHSIIKGVQDHYHLPAAPKSTSFWAKKPLNNPVSPEDHRLSFELRHTLTACDRLNRITLSKENRLRLFSAGAPSLLGLQTPLEAAKENCLAEASVDMFESGLFVDDTHENTASRASTFRS